VFFTDEAWFRNECFFADEAWFRNEFFFSQCEILVNRNVSRVW
jgi:hypothetical protein